jgi:ABC-type Na+ efflux pump permease subunit
MIMIIVLPMILWGMNIFILTMRVGGVPGGGNSVSAPQLSEGQQISADILDPADISIELGIPAMIAIIVTFLSVNPFVASSIAGEREKKTMELLLSLPISRRKILLGKFSAGTVLGIIALLINLFFMWVFVQVMNELIIPTNPQAKALGIKISIDMVTMTINLLLCTILNLGIGISLASLVKSAETSRQLFTLFILPIFLLIFVVMVTGIPEVLSNAMDSPLPLLLYMIPWIHAIAILQKSLLPDFFTSNDFLLSGNVLMDNFLHLIAIFVTLALVMWAASKVFEREGLVS